MSPFPTVNNFTCNKTSWGDNSKPFSIDVSDMNLLWHYRLGHVSFRKMKRIYNIPVTFAPKQPFLYIICHMVRQARLPFPLKVTNTTVIFDLLHVDLWGPYHVPTHDNFKYFLTIVGDCSRSTWTHLLSCKSNALHTLRSFISIVETQVATSIKCIRSDNGLEFTSTEATSFFQSKGIEHQRTCPYTPPAKWHSRKKTQIPIENC